MKQESANIQKTKEFNTLFLNLNDKWQEVALIVLKSLSFAQSIQSDEHHNS